MNLRVKYQIINHLNRSPLAARIGYTGDFLVYKKDIPHYYIFNGRSRTTIDILATIQSIEYSSNTPIWTLKTDLVLYEDKYTSVHLHTMVAVRTKFYFSGPTALTAQNVGEILI